MNLLLIEDEQNLSDMMKDSLKSAFPLINVKQLFSYKDFLDEIKKIKSYDIVVIDIMLGGIRKVRNGINIVKYIREKRSNTPIIVVSGLKAINWLEIAFEVGADDYLIKPFMMKELEIRIKKCFKKIFYPKLYSGDFIDYHFLLYKFSENNFYYKDKLIELTKTSKLILYIFISKPEVLISKNEILNRVWGDGIINKDLRPSLFKLKKSLKTYGINSWIITIRGEGYIFKEV